MDKKELKKALGDLGIRVYGNKIRKADLKRILAEEDLTKDISEIKKLLHGIKLDKYAKAYYDKLDLAAKAHGKDGLMSQVAYLLSNLEGVLKPDIEKRLLNYAENGTF